MVKIKCKCAGNYLNNSYDNMVGLVTERLMASIPLQDVIVGDRLCPFKVW